MSSRYSTLIMLAIAVPFVTAPIALAQRQPSPYSGVPGGVPGMRTAPPGAGVSNEPMGMEDTFSATVAEVDQQQQTVTLRTTNGQMVELELPEQLLMGLSQGDSVQVSIQKMDGYPETGTQGTGVRSSIVPPSRPEAGSIGQTGTRTRQPRASQ